MQRAVNVKVDVTAFVSKIARSAVLTRVEMREGGQIRIRCAGPAFGYFRVHRGLCIKMRWRIYPNDIEVSDILRTCPDGQRVFEVHRVHLVPDTRDRGMMVVKW